MKSFNILTTLFVLFLLISNSVAQKSLKQTVRGKVTDKISSAPMPGVNILLVDSLNKIGTATNANGEFELKNVPVGRNSFMVTSIGYEPVNLRNIIVNSGKELVLEIEMTESLIELNEVSVTAYRKGEVLNKMATISAQSFTIEETERYAGSWSDPARMATNFAGVLKSGNDTRNDIIIRGNSPTGLLWRLDGIDIPNPNHFAVQGTSGGPVSMLNSNLLTRSDFFTGAFPAQYGNALGGVFDLNMRNGNYKKTEFVLQAGLNGYEAGIEGPFSKKSNASYMLNWRYSFLDVLKKLGFNIVGGAVPTYSDINFKINVPTQKAGTFSIFGLGGIDDVKAESENSTDQFNPIRNSDLKNHTIMGVAGITHKLIQNERSNLRTSVAFSRQETHISLDSIKADKSKFLFYSSNFIEDQLTFSLHYTTKISPKSTYSTGLSFKNKFIEQNDSAFYMGSFIDLISLSHEKLLLMQFFAEYKHRFSTRFELYTGIHVQHLFLNNTHTFEPRLGWNWFMTNKQSLKFGYGIHGQTQSLPVYFVETSDASRTKTWKTCEGLDFTKAQHFVLGYENHLANNLNLKLEAYYQDIWDVPVDSKPSNFSVLNLGATYYNGTQDKDSLVNNGLGKNYGIELTLEKYLNKNWYFLATSSLFKSLYKPSDKIWRNTVFSSNYAANALLGFEFPINKNSSLDFNIRFVWSGGIRALYVDKEKSLLAGVVVYDDEKAYSDRYKDYMKGDFKMTFRHNSRHKTIEFAIDIANITDRDNIFSETFNPKDGTTLTTYQQGFLPTAMIRITF